MREAAFWTLLLLGALLIVAYVATTLITAAKGGQASVNNQAFWDFLKQLAEKAPMLAGGIILLALAAVLAGGLSAEVIFSDPTPAPS